jgi:hypothetical protein
LFIIIHAYFLWSIFPPFKYTIKFLTHSSVISSVDAKRGPV